MLDFTSKNLYEVVFHYILFHLIDSGPDQLFLVYWKISTI